MARSDLNLLSSGAKTLRKQKELSGTRFGRLLVIRRAEKGSYLVCVCDCGKQKEVLMGHLVSGKTKSCGCLNSEVVALRNRTHGDSQRGSVAKEYAAWQGMLKRCYCKLSIGYKNYGGRGIEVCVEWKKSYENFLRDMGRCPEGMSIDRIDVNGNYDPGNCRWASTSTQAYNKRTYANNTSGRKGVSFSKKVSRYHAYIGVDGKLIWLGRFASFEDACCARSAAEERYYSHLLA